MQGGEEPAALLGGEDWIVVGTAKMREDAREPQVRGGEYLLVKCGGFFVPHAEAAHAGVDFKVNRERAFGRASDVVQASDLVRRRHGHGDIVFEHMPVFIGEQRA